MIYIACIMTICGFLCVCKIILVKGGGGRGIYRAVQTHCEGVDPPEEVKVGFYKKEKNQTMLKK